MLKLLIIFGLHFLCEKNLVAKSIDYAPPRLGGPNPLQGNIGPPYGSSVYSPMLYGNPKYPLPSRPAFAATPLMSTDPDCANFTAAECKMRQKKCQPIGTLASGPSGPVKDIFTCTTALSIPKASFVGFIGDAFKSGHPETIIEKVTDDPIMSYHLRRCVLIQNGLLGLNDTINRMILNANIQKSIGWNPPLAQLVLESAEDCPDPTDLMFSELLSCMRSKCVQKLPISSFAYSDPKENDDD